MSDYICKNLKSGNEYPSNFNKSHHSYFGGNTVRFIAVDTIDRIADDLIAMWNRQQPNDWHYTRVRTGAEIKSSRLKENENV